MPKTRERLSTGLPGLDKVFRGLMQGDNIVWQVDSIEHYRPLVVPFARHALKNQRKVVYFRFADHLPLLELDSEAAGVEVCHLQPELGFEPFLAEIHRTINQAGRGCMYVFDCLSELAPDWCSDRMLGNFFMLTCPYIYDRASIAYFAILRNSHSFHALTPITDTTQILVDAYRYQDRFYVHPLKVQYRHSPTMYTLHAWEEETFRPVTQSYIITEILSGIPWSRLDSASYQLGYWSKTFSAAEMLQEKLAAAEATEAETVPTIEHLLHMVISRDSKVLGLAKRFFSLRDILDIRRRMIGTGLIGGKAVGMLLAQAILRRSNPRWNQLLETHDSFFIGSDVFYTYLVQNDCWWLLQRLKQAYKTPAKENELADETDTIRRRVLSGTFPDYIVKQFADMLDYFGQSPIIVRSSSLLEDNFGNAFAGKYESVFCANQGGPTKRLEDFLLAVRTVYASMMSEEALTYRVQRGLLERDEQMALLIQRVSGASYGNYFFPQAAGVGFSFNPYVWHQSIDPHAGMLRVVFGVGTRAVDRSDDDYTRIVALNAPDRRPEANFDEVRQYAQRRVDVLDLEVDQLISARFEDVLKQAGKELPIKFFASRDHSVEKQMRKGKHRHSPFWVLTFDQLFSRTDFITDMREMLQTIQDAYQYPVDIEFTVNFFDQDRYRINLVQCRPLQVRVGGLISPPPPTIPPEHLLVETRNAIIGISTELQIDWFIYVVPSRYGELPLTDRFAIARAIGELCHHPEINKGAIMLLGPGRWGTSSPELGVPVSFADISTVSIVGEIVMMRDNLIPDVSLGTHFFNELVENDMLYFALFPPRESSRLHTAFFETALPNHLTEFLPDAAEQAPNLRLLRAADAEAQIRLNANTLQQRLLCYMKSETETPPG